MTRQRSARTVLDDHLRLAQIPDVETDLARNFADDVVLLTSYGAFHGKAGVREAAKLLQDQLPSGRWTYHQVVTEGELGFLEWSGTGENGARVEDGADSFIIRGGRIRAMSIHYTVQPAQRESRAPAAINAYPHRRNRTMQAGRRDPRYHTQHMQQRLQEMIEHLRADIDDIDEPQLRAMFETSAEVLAGLSKALHDYEQQNEKAWCR